MYNFIYGSACATIDLNGIWWHHISQPPKAIECYRYRTLPETYTYIAWVPLAPLHVLNHMCQRGGLVQHHLSCFGFLSNMCSQHSCPTIADLSIFHDIYNRQQAPVLAVWQSHCHLQKVEAPVGCFLGSERPTLRFFGSVDSKGLLHRKNNSQHSTNSETSWKTVAKWRDVWTVAIFLVIMGGRVTHRP